LVVFLVGPAIDRSTIVVLLPLLRLTLPTEGFPWCDLRTILQGGQRMAKVQSGKEILPKVGVRTLQTTDRRQKDLQ